MGKSRILIRELIHKNLVSLRCFLFQVNLQDKPSILVLLLVSTVAADSDQDMIWNGVIYLLVVLRAVLLLLLLQVQIVSANRAKVSLFHSSYLVSG